MKCTHAIFDMDGTLVNTTAYSIRACREAAAQMGLPAPGDGLITGTIGYSADEYYRIIMPGVPEDTAREYGLLARVLERQGLAELGPAILFPGVGSMLRALREGGASLYVASTGEEEYVRLALGAAGIAGLFSAVEAGEPRKEAMAIRLRAGAPEGNWAFVGDRFKDADAARAAGMPSYFAGWGFSPAEEGGLFDAVVRTPGELLAALGYGGGAGA